MFTGMNPGDAIAIRGQDAEEGKLTLFSWWERGHFFNLVCQSEQHAIIVGIHNGKG